jgi:hypothetical protein
VILAFETGIVIGVDSRAAKQGAQDVQRALGDVGTTAEQTQRRTDAAMGRLRSGFSGVGEDTRRLRGQIQQLSFQFNDVISGLAAGTGPMTLLVQQGGQIAQIFGPLFGVGGVLAIGAVALTSAFARMGGEVEGVAEAMKRLGDAADAGFRKSREFVERGLQIDIQSIQAEIKKLEEAQKRAGGELGRPQGIAQRIDRAITGILPGSRESSQDRLNELRRIEAGIIQAEAERANADDLKQRLDTIRDTIDAQKKADQESAKAQAERIRRDQDYWADYAKREQDELKHWDRVLDNIKKKEAGLNRHIEALESESQLAGMSKDDQEVIRALIEAQNRLYDEQGKKIRDITDEERKRIEGAVRDRQRIEKENRDIERAKREAEREADKIRQQQEHAVEQSTDRLVDFAGDAIFDRLSGRTKSFWETFRDFGLRAIAQLAAEMAVRPLVMPIVASVVGGVGGSPVGGSGGLLGGGGGFGDILSLGSNLFGGGGLGSGGSLLSGMGVSGFGSGMGFLGAGGIGLGIGGLIGSFSPFGKTGYGGMIGGGIGGLAGFALGGPIGAVVGSVLGGLGGSLFGPGKSVGPGANANLILQNGQFAVGGSAADNGGNVSQAIQTTQQLAQALNSLVGAAGLKTAGSGFQLDAGYFQDQLFLGAGGGPGVNTLLQTSDPDALALAAFRQLYGRGNIYGATGSVATVLANSQATTLSGLASDLDFAKQIDTLITDGPTLADSLKQITDQFEQMRSRAQALGIDLTKFDQAQQKATENFFKNALGGIDAFRTSLLTSDLSPLNPLGKITEAQSLFNETLKKAQAGDISAINALPGVGQSLLGLGRQYYASGSGYQDLFRGVNEGLGTVLSANSGGRDLAMVFQTSTQDIVDAQNATIQELGAKLDDLKKEMRNLVLAYKAA